MFDISYISWDSKTPNYISCSPAKRNFILHYAYLKIVIKNPGIIYAIPGLKFFYNVLIKYRNFNIPIVMESLKTIKITISTTSTSIVVTGLPPLLLLLFIWFYLAFLRVIQIKIR